MAPAETPGTAADGEIGILHRRKIEAAIIAPIYAGMVREIGEARAQAILDAAISQPPSMPAAPLPRKRKAAPA